MSTPSPSRTAEYMALFRAMETSSPRPTRLFVDSFAAGFLRPSLRVALLCANLPGVRKGILNYIDHRWPGARTAGVARTRLIDDWMIEGLRQGFEQIVILGAGFDARPYRLSGHGNARFFEVDQPGTSRAKRRLMEEQLGVLPAHVAYVEVDFNRQDLGPALQSAGFLPEKRSFFVWEGVTGYLTEPAVDATLRWVGSAAPSGQMVFTYLDKQVLTPPEAFRGTVHLRRKLAQSDERWTFGLDPSEVRGYLAERGLELIEDLGACDFRACYLGQPGIGYEFYHVARARVHGMPNDARESATLVV